MLKMYSIASGEHASLIVQSPSSPRVHSAHEKRAILVNLFGLSGSWIVTTLKRLSTRLDKSLFFICVTPSSDSNSPLSNVTYRSSGLRLSIFDRYASSILNSASVIFVSDNDCRGFDFCTKNLQSPENCGSVVLFGMIITSCLF